MILSIFLSCLYTKGNTDKFKIKFVRVSPLQTLYDLLFISYCSLVTVRYVSIDILFAMEAAFYDDRFHVF